MRRALRGLVGVKAMRNDVLLPKFQQRGCSGNGEMAARVEGVSEEILRSYREHWNHIRFRKGWATPLFSFEEVEELLRQAAVTAAHLLTEIEDASDGPVFRQRGGDSMIFLSSVTYHPDGQKERFVRELLHSTLCDARGYILGLTEERIDTMSSHVNRITAYSNATSPIVNGIEELKELVNNLDVELQGTTPSKVLEHLEAAKRLLEGKEVETKVEDVKEEVEMKVEDVKEEEEVGAVEVEAEAEVAPPPHRIDVTGVEKKIASLVSAADVQWDVVKKDPQSYEKELETLQQKCSDSSAVLMKDLLALEQELSSDEGVVHDKEERTRLRGQVKTIHKLLENVDEVTRRVQVLKTATQDEKERQSALKGKKPGRRPTKNSSRSQERKEQVKQLVNKVIMQLRDDATWHAIEVSPEFSVRTGAEFSYATAYLPSLRTDQCQVNASNHGVLTISGVCIPTQEDLRPHLEYFVNTAMQLAASDEGVTYLAHQVRDPVDFIRTLTEAKWGRFAKSYRLPAPIPAETVRATVCII